MDASKPGKGILASLEHAKGKPPVHSAPRGGPGPALVIGSGVLVGAVLAWWIYSGPSPVLAHDGVVAVPRPVLAVPATAAPLEPAPGQAAAIIDSAAPPAPTTSSASLAPAAAVAAALAPAPIAAVVLRRERPPAVRPPPKPARRDYAARPGPVAASDSDVALLTALVAHASGSDVVEPHLADSTASLLQRCGRVGGEEGRLCRLRICAIRADDGACGTQ